ncbi:unnamed protein product [Calypogeia fissa]
MAPSNVLIIGGTGSLGQHILNASVKFGYPTSVLVRTLTPSDPAKAQLLKSFQDAKVTLLVGDLTDKASIVRRQCKGVIVAEEDIGMYTMNSTMKTIEDPRAANKNMFIKPEKCIASQNEVIAMWEKKIRHVFEKECMSGEEVFKSITELPFPVNCFRALFYHCGVKGT